MEQQTRCIPHPYAGAEHGPVFGLNVWRRGHVSTLVLLLAAVYCWTVVRAVKPGLPRLLFCLPAMATIHAVPLLFDHQLEPIATIAATFLAVRLTSGKVSMAHGSYSWEQQQP